MINKTKPYIRRLLGHWLYERGSRVYRRLRYGRQVAPQPTEVAVEEIVPFLKTTPSAFTNFIVAKYERFSGHIKNQSTPYFMFMDPSSICQLRCPYCPTGAENAAKKENKILNFRTRTMMADHLFDHLIEELGQDLFFVSFYNWGEPLLNRKVPKYIQKAKSYGIYTQIHTNLSLKLSDEYIEELLLSGLDEIDASIDGFSQESYGIYRQGGNFELAKAMLERLTQKRNELGTRAKIVWNFLVFSFNEHEIEAVAQYCKNLGIEFNRREAFINIKERPEWLPSYRKDELKSLKKSPAAEPLGRFARKNSAPKETSCSWHYGISVINADGSVSPCCIPWEQKYDFGNVVPGQVGFREIWNNAAFQKSRSIFAGKPSEEFKDVHTLCEECSYSPELLNLYVPMEKRIVANFWALPNQDPVVKRAFELLDDPIGFVDYCRSNSAHLGIVTASTNA